MKKFIKSSLLLFTAFIAFTLSGCDSLQNFLFDLPIEFTINADGASNTSGSESYCLTNDDTYQQYANKINSVTYADAYFVTREISDATLTGNVTFQLLDGNNNEILSYSDNNIVPADHDSTNAYHLMLDQTQIDDINASLDSGNRCFTGVYSFEVTSGGNNSNNHIEIDIQVLFTLDTSL